MRTGLLSGLRLTAALLFLFAILANAEGKSWRSIEPFHSTRADVERLLGETEDKGPRWQRYDLLQEEVHFIFGDQDESSKCTTAMVNVVLRIEVTPKWNIWLSELELNTQKATKFALPN